MIMEMILISEIVQHQIHSQKKEKTQNTFKKKQQHKNKQFTQLFHHFYSPNNQ